MLKTLRMWFLTHFTVDGAMWKMRWRAKVWRRKKSRLLAESDGPLVCIFDNGGFRDRERLEGLSFDSVDAAVDFMAGMYEFGCPRAMYGVFDKETGAIVARSFDGVARALDKFGPPPQFKHIPSQGGY